MLETTKTSPRKFGFIFIAYFGLVIALLLWRHHSITHLVWIAFAVSAVLALFVPQYLKPIRFVWDGVLSLLRYINTRLLLGILFFGIFMPIALIRKLFKKDSLGLRYDASCKTYRTQHDMQNDLRRPF